MADLDMSLAAAFQQGGVASLRAGMESGFYIDLLEGDGRRAFQFIFDFYKQYGDVPSTDVIMAETGILLSPASDPLPYLINAVYERKIHKTLYRGVEEVADLLANKQPQQGRQSVENLLRELRALDTRGALVESLPGLGNKVIDYYEKIKRGERGIQTPWESINEATLGFWPEDLVLFVARMGIGKSWVATMLAGCAWDQGKKVLMATTEMAKERLAMRYFAYKFRLPYDQFRKGRLDMFSEKKFYEGVQQLISSPNLHIVGGDFDFSMETFAGIVQDEKPDIVIVDGAYLMKVPGLTRTERAANVFDELKRVAKRTKASVIATMQFNREVKVNQAKTVQADSIALTDVAGWNADLIFGLIQTEEMKQNKRMAFKPLKVREGSGEEIECNWDFDTMDFTEIPKATPMGGASTVMPSNIPTTSTDTYPDDAPF